MPKDGKRLEVGRTPLFKIHEGLRKGEDGLLTCCVAMGWTVILMLDLLSWWGEQKRRSSQLLKDLCACVSLDLSRFFPPTKMGGRI